MIRSIVMIFVLSLGLLLINGCSDSSSDGAAENENSKINGVASKGLIVRGVVTAFAIVDDKISETSLATTTTDENGEYTIDLGSYIGPVHLVVTPAEDGSSTVKCDAELGCDTNGDGSVDVPFGESMNLDFTMEAMVPKAERGATVQGSITPLTHMAASYAREFGLKEVAIRRANERVEQLLGVVGILETKPVDVTAANQMGNEVTANAMKYGFLAAAIANIAQKDTKGNIGQTIKNLANSYKENGGELVAKESANETSNVSLKEIVQAALDQAASRGASSNTAIKTTLEDLKGLNGKVDELEEDATTSTELSSGVTTDDIADAKAAVAHFRTWATALNETQQQIYQEKAQAYAEQLSMAEKLESAAVETVVQSLAKSVKALATVYRDESDGSHDIANYIVGDGISGQVVKNGDTVSISDAVIDGATVNVGLSLKTTDNMTYTLAFSPSNVTTAKASLAIDTGSTTVKFSSLVDDILNVSETNEVVSFDMKIDANLSQVASDVNPNPVSYRGLIEMVGVENSHIGLQPARLAFSGQLQNPNNSIGIAFEINFRNADSFNPVQPSARGLQKKDLVRYVFSQNGNKLLLTYPQKIVIYQLSGNQVTRTVIHEKNNKKKEILVVASNTVSLAEFLAALEDLPMLKHDDDGEYRLQRPEAWGSNTGVLHGVLETPAEDGENQTTWYQVDMSLSFMAKFDSLPEAKVTIGINRISKRKYTVSLAVEDDQANVKLQAGVKLWQLYRYQQLNSGHFYMGRLHSQLRNSINFNEKDLGLIVTDKSTGSRFVVHPTPKQEHLVGKVIVNGNAVAVISEENKLGNQLLVTYSDDTFESLVF